MTPEQIEIVESATMHVRQAHMEGVAPGTEGMSPFDWLDTDEIAETILAQQSEIDRLRAKVEAGDALAKAMNAANEYMGARVTNCSEPAPYQRCLAALTAYREAGHD